jgi:hypothetical protein
MQTIAAVDPLHTPPAAAHAQRSARDKARRPAARASGLAQTSFTDLSVKWKHGTILSIMWHVPRQGCRIHLKVVEI